ncbi:MAG TPA: hypothetical protein VLC09_14720 [Polyangiaceae bacterium]|nr:hypothetical protein [Polyangiaceae bacterium]
MADRPILFSGPMVRAILDGTKTQTRRVVSGALQTADGGWEHVSGARWRQVVARGPVFPETYGPAIKCPYGVAGDRLWVRETFDSRNSAGERWKPKDSAFVVFRDGAQMYSDGTYSPPLESYAPGAFDLCRWRPSIHMPRWASRITLEVTAVRVERLQDISEEDAQAEGIERGEDFFQCPTWRDYMPGDEAASWFPDDPIGSYSTLWDSINGAGAWDANLWVWVVEFRRLEAARG